MKNFINHEEIEKKVLNQEELTGQEASDVTNNRCPEFEMIEYKDHSWEFINAYVKHKESGRFFELCIGVDDDAINYGVTPIEVIRTERIVYDYKRKRD